MVGDTGAGRLRSLEAPKNRESPRTGGIIASFVGDGLFVGAVYSWRQHIVLYLLIVLSHSRVRGRGGVLAASGRSTSFGTLPLSSGTSS